MIPTQEIFHSSLALTGQLTKLQLKRNGKNGEIALMWFWKKKIYGMKMIGIKANILDKLFLFFLLLYEAIAMRLLLPKW